MSEYNFQQGLRDLAQAAQLSAANEAAKNSAKLLEAQKQQAAIEQQKLQLDQIRLQEDRARHEAAQNKLERHKAIRNAMAEMERILRSFTRDIAGGRLNQIIGGVSLISFLGALTRRQLQMVGACKEELEDLSDIRFMGSLQESFADLVSGHSGELAAHILDNAIQKLIELASWSGAAGEQYIELESETGELSKSLQTSNEQQNSLSKIQSNLNLVEARLQKINEIEALAAQFWPDAQANTQALELVGIRSGEVELLTGMRLSLSLQDFNENCNNLRHELDQIKICLIESKSVWHSDKLLVENLLMEIEKGNVDKLECDKSKIQRIDWTDLDVNKVIETALENRKSIQEQLKRHQVAEATRKELFYISVALGLILVFILLLNL
jgi:hypothetical protein